jgi:DNA-binding LacI/PurR family transcriptional regulator
MELMAAGRGVRLVLGVSHYDSRIERVQAERLLALGASGLILAPTTAVKPDGVAEWLASLAVPVVLLERMVDGIDVGRQFDSVCSDHVVGCALAVRHLLGLGHRRIRLALYDRTPTAPRLRLGIAEATQRFGLEPAQVEVVPKGEEDPDELVVALRRLLRECRRTGTTAVIAHTDFHAARLVEVAESMDIAVPADLAVIAYDDELADSAIVPLTAVTAPRLEVGRAALAMLLERLDPAGGLEAVRHLQLLPRLTVRQSCGAHSEWR